MDFNSDGKIDLVAGDSEGNVWFFENVGTKTEPKLAKGVKLQANGKTITGTPARYEKGADNTYRMVPQPDAAMGVYSKLHVADWDNNGLLDILVGQDSARSHDEQLVLYRNIGTPREAKLAGPVPLTVLKNPLSRPSPYLVDWDGDGKRDLLLGTEMNQVMFLKNTGTQAKPEYARPEPLPLPGFDSKCYRCRLAVVDWNNDGKLDLLVGTVYSQGGGGNRIGGNVWLFLRK